MIEPRPLGLDTHIDVFGHQTNHRLGVLCLEPERNIDDAVIVGLILGGIKKRNLSGIL